MTSRTRLQRKEVDDVLGGDAMWKDVDQTDGAPILNAVTNGGWTSMVPFGLKNFPRVQWIRRR
ncbi:hypothetical protein FRC10_006934 [Ceratobasidium sp. 414]|nr:hypothetical protein FRC10_006934 [Ceratobasidium sp. 414]